MKKFLILLFILSSCDLSEEVKKNQLKIKYSVVKEIDSCEYIVASNANHNSFSITHKGNCKNPKHECNEN